MSTKKKINNQKKIKKIESQINKLRTSIKYIEVFCNNCGKSCRINKSKDNYGLINATVHGGYESNNLNDCSTYKFSLCESCLSRLFMEFKIPPDITSY